MGVLSTKTELDKLYKQREELDKKIQKCEDKLKWYDEQYKDDCYYQKHGIPFEEVHDYSP